MSHLDDFLDQRRAGRVCLVGLGNPEYGDDGFGVRLAEELIDAGVPDVIAAGTTPEWHLGRITNERFDHVVFVDAVEFGAEAGSVVLLGRSEMEVRFPQISTHKISLGVLAQLVESNGKTRVWLLGVQPESLRRAHTLSPAVRKTTRILKELLLRRSHQPVEDRAVLEHDTEVRTC